MRRGRHRDNIRYFVYSRNIEFRKVVWICLLIQIQGIELIGRRNEIEWYVYIIISVQLLMNS